MEAAGASKKARHLALPEYDKLNTQRRHTNARDDVPNGPGRDGGARRGWGRIDDRRAQGAIGARSDDVFHRAPLDNRGAVVRHLQYPIKV